MFTQMNDLTKAVVCYGIVFLLTVGIALLPVGEVVLLLAMLAPTVSVLLMMLVVTRDGRSRAGWATLGLRRPGLRAWPFAVVAPFSR